MKKIKIKLLKPFSDVVGKKDIELDFEGSTLKDLLRVLVIKFPALEKEFFTDTKNLNEYVCIFINDKPLSSLNGIGSKITNNDEILFFIPLSGG